MPTPVCVHPLASLSFMLTFPLFAQITLAQQTSADIDRQVMHNSVDLVTTTPDAEKLIYAADYLRQLNAVSATDLLKRIPGIQGLLQDATSDQRGFGSAGDQLLINGQRISGKSNGADAVLDRIQAIQVERIEVIRGTSPDTDVRSQGRVVNVVLENNQHSAYGAIAAKAISFASGGNGHGVELSRTGSRGLFDYVLALENQTESSRTHTNNLVFSPACALQEQEAISTQTHENEFLFSANTSFTFLNGNQFSLNSLFEQEQEADNQLTSVVEAPGGQFVVEKQNVRVREIGADYRHLLQNGHRWTTLLILADNVDNGFGQSFDTETVETQSEFSRSDEHILRSAYQWSASQHHAFESGLEVAINKVRESSKLFENHAGALQEIALENASSMIQEHRYELFLNHGWQLNEQLALDNSLNLEHSALQQRGPDINRQQRFFYISPRLGATYNLNEQSQIRGRIEQTVSQLDFGDFTTSFAGDNNRFDVIYAGNPELEPELAREYQLSYQYQMQDDRGAIEISALYADIHKHIDLIPLRISTDDGTSMRAAPGNIGDARRIELRLNGSMRLDRLNIRGAVLDATLTLRNTQALDAFTQTKRQMTALANYQLTWSYRQDISDQLSFRLESEHYAGERSYDLDYFGTLQRGTKLDFIVEWRLADNLQLRLEADNLLGTRNQRNRVIYDNDRATGTIKQREQRSGVPDRETSLNLNWTF